MRIPTDKKIKKDKNISKYILRKVASNYLPDSIAWRENEEMLPEAKAIYGAHGVKIIVTFPPLYLFEIGNCF